MVEDFFKEDEHGEIHAVDQVFYDEDEQWKWLKEHGFVFVDGTRRHQLFSSNTVQCTGWGGFIAVTSTIWNEEAEEESKKFEYKIRFYDSLLDAIYEYKN